MRVATDRLAQHLNDPRLAQHLNDPKIRIVEAYEGVLLYKQGHILEAVKMTRIPRGGQREERVDDLASLLAWDRPLDDDRASGRARTGSARSKSAKEAQRWGR